MLPRRPRLADSDNKIPAEERPDEKRPSAKKSAAKELVILGLDPGSRFTGWGVVERRGSRLAVRGHGRISLPSKSPLAERLVTLDAEIARLVDVHRPHVAALESLFHGVNPKSLIVLAQARGVILTSVCRAGLPVHEYSPAEVKSAVTGNGRADKQQVAKMVGLLLGLRGRSPSADATDALAVAICYGQRARLDALGARRRRARKGGETP